MTRKCCIQSRPGPYSICGHRQNKPFYWQSPTNQTTNRQRETQANAKKIKQMNAKVNRWWWSSSSSWSKHTHKLTQTVAQAVQNDHCNRCAQSCLGRNSWLAQHWTPSNGMDTQRQPLLLKLHAKVNYANGKVHHAIFNTLVLEQTEGERFVLRKTYSFFVFVCLLLI